MKCSKCAGEGTHRIAFSDHPDDYVHACDEHRGYYEAYKAACERSRKRLAVAVTEEPGS